MSRNAVAHDSAEESFAVLLEHLTRHSRPEPPASESRPDFASKTRSSSASVSNQGARSGTRSLLPVTELKPGRGIARPATQDSSPLSYEQALRLHARRGTATNGNLDLPRAPRPETAPSLPKTAPDPGSGKTAKTAKSGRKSKLKSKSKPASNTPRPSGKKNLAKLERPDLQWNPAGPVDFTSRADLMSPVDLMPLPDQRRAIVSLRLTDNELLRLKDRAGESGISVSAYMRSCIVDADQLRAQVKQALAEMRALSTRPDPSRFPALAVSNDSAAGVDWLRLLMRSAAFLLSPLFPFRRGA